MAALVTDAGAQQGLSRKRGQIGARSGAGVVAVGVSNQRAIDGEGRIDMEIPGRAVQAGFANLQKRHMLIVLRPRSRLLVPQCRCRVHAENPQCRRKAGQPGHHE